MSDDNENATRANDGKAKPAIPADKGAKEEGPKAEHAEVLYYDYREIVAKGGGVAAKPVPGDCPECGGTGEILLLVSSRLCGKCGGSGHAEPAGADGRQPPVPRNRRTQSTFDAQGRLIEQMEWIEPPAGPKATGG